MTVLHYVPRWLPVTEGFVARVIAGSDLPGSVLSRERPTAPAPPGVPVRSLRSPRSDRVAEAGVTGAAVLLRARLVHVHFGYRLRDARRLLGRRPVVVSLHGHDVTAFARQWPHYYRGVLDRADAVVVPSQHLAGRAVDAGAPHDRVHVVPSGVDLARFRPTPLPDGPPVLLFVGRLVEKKGLDVLLAAWPAVRAAVPGAVLRVVGDGPLAATVRGEGVTAVGALGPTAVADELRTATVICSPSRTSADGDEESLLLVNLEAQAAGRPVVTTRHGGIPEFVDDGRSALLVDEADATGLAEALVTVLRDRGLAARLGAGGPGVAARFDARVCARRVDDEVYRPLLG